METNDILAITSIVISLITAGATIILSYRYNKLVQAQVEMQIRERITNARTRYEDFIISHVSKIMSKIKELAYESIKEDLLNAYEEACQKYLDAKVDKKRFKKSYSKELQKLVADKNFIGKYDSKSTQYEATVKVYEKWFNVEK